MTAIVTRGDAGNLHLPDETVDLIVTSPPYFGLRSYQDGGEHYAGQVGDETTPAEYLDALIACTREWMRVLKPGGSIFVNLGDKYASGDGSGNQSSLMGGRPATRGAGHARIPRHHSVPTKSLTGLPWRYALRCIDELGLILRAEIVWAKPNGLPESVTDRVRRSHEQVFHFTKSPRYYSAVDEVRTPHLSAVKPGRRLTGGAPLNEGGQRFGADGSRHTDGHPLGALPGSVWEIPTAPLKVPDSLGVDHFAAYPPELVRRIVLGWSPREVCTACGEGRRPVVSKVTLGKSASYDRTRSTVNPREWLAMKAANPDTISGYACACGQFPGSFMDPDTTPGVVLDPFGGTGTTALVASAFGRVGISVDLSADYCRLARWRTSDPSERARVLGVAKPPVQVTGQIDLFAEEAS